ncbi:MAG: type II secretion system F family protein [Candidatus Aenigmarchaeota archaeon]|nr:type II secretion system F family protein [Candidatus Aenigmarchaeota archaeon]
MLYKLMPNGYKSKIQELLTYSGSKRTVASFVNYSFAISLAFGFIVGVLVRDYFIVLFPACFLGLLGFFHGMLYLAVDRRTKFVERILPDALQLVAANIRSGFIPSRAILLSARKEFGPLSEAIKQVGKEMMTGKSLQDSMKEITKTIKSDILDTTVKLVVRGVRSGGQLFTLFEETAADIRSREAINKEIRANILTYSIFIFFAAAIGAPALYALSLFLVGTITKITSSIQLPKDFSSNVPLVKLTGVTVSPEFMFIFAMLAITITSVFGGIIIGLIGSGKERDGIKFIPVLLGISLLVFFVAGGFINSIFSTLIPV